MATRSETAPVEIFHSRLERRHNPGRPPIYPWEQWTDGAWWTVSAGVDFECSLQSFRVGLSERARRIGRPGEWSVQASKLTGADAPIQKLAFRFFKTEERAGLDDGYVPARPAVEFNDKLVQDILVAVAGRVTRTHTERSSGFSAGLDAALYAMAAELVDRFNIEPTTGGILCKEDVQIVGED